MDHTGQEMNPKERFEHLLKVISSERFLNKRGLGNEVPFFICPYPADQAVAIETMRANLVNQLTNLGVHILEINLYDLSISLLRERAIWEQIIATEQECSKEELKELLQGVLDPQGHLIPAIRARLLEHEFDVLFLSGVGEVFPFIRSHNVLNNLQSTAKEKPTMLFFPVPIPTGSPPVHRLIFSGSCMTTSTIGPLTFFTMRYEAMTLKIRQIFEKPIDRPIEGVIKADDEASLRTELGEYVITKEIEGHLGKFLDAYVNYETANGAWISGDFGSGKSHLLKMLALLMENRIVDGISAYDLFEEKCADNAILAGDLRRAVAIPSKSILFNIDQKADVIVKEQIDALLSVFQKVFDETCGYYGKQPHIAQFERDLDGRGVLTTFKAAYQRQTNKPWERGREEYILEGANIARAYAEATGLHQSEGQGVLIRYRQDFRLSIEDFAQKVKDYIDKQGPTFRLNFLVDEIGQYIAGNVKLMTNLQTIPESLSTKCRGRSWVIVTAQQDMETVIGDMTQRQEIDFSKIQDRLKIRMPLNSGDVAEVISDLTSQEDRRKFR